MIPHPQMGIAHFEMEIIYSAIIIAACLLIFFRTKELYNLSSHKGIKYFRDAFLFLAAAYVIRLLGEVFTLTKEFFLSPRPHFMIAGFLFSFASTMAIICLIYSVSWREGDKKSVLHKFVLPLLAVFVPLISMFLRYPRFPPQILVIFFQTVLLLYVLYLDYKHHKKDTHSKQTRSFHVIYLLLYFFWILNFIVIFVPRFMFELKIVLYIVSAVLFLVILTRVYKRT